jgi:2-methylisocitrate lyase-like PEP mutase family enzyme
MNQKERACYFRQLHSRKPLILPNAWDAGSAGVIEKAGAVAIGTTSAGISWSFGRHDGQTLRRDEMLMVIENIVRTVTVPVTADIESGYGHGSIEEVVELVRLLIAMGVAGINLEDSPGRDGDYLRSAEEQAARIRAIREAVETADADLVINARTDVFLFQVGEPSTRFDVTIERADAYLTAGADCIFVPGVADDETIRRLAVEVDGPVNIAVSTGISSARRLGELGVARLSAGPAFAQAAMAAVQRAAREFIELGTYTFLDGRLPMNEILQMLQSSTI